MPWEETSKNHPNSRGMAGNTGSQLATQLDLGPSPERLLTKCPPRAGKANPTSHSRGETPALPLPAQDLELRWEHAKRNACGEGKGEVLVTSSTQTPPGNVARQVTGAVLLTQQRGCRAFSGDELKQWAACPLQWASPVQGGWSRWPPCGPSSGRGRQHATTTLFSFSGKRN